MQFLQHIYALEGFYLQPKVCSEMAYPTDWEEGIA